MTLHDTTTITPVIPGSQRQRRALRRAIYNLAICAILCGSLVTAGCHPAGGTVSTANYLGDLAYSAPEQAAQRAAAEIVKIQKMFTNPRIVDEKVFKKFRGDYYADRFALSMCQNYMTIGECNAQIGAWEAAEDAYLKSIEAANKWVGYHIQYVTNTTPEVFRTVKAYFRGKKIETVAYLKLREIARQTGNSALATVYDIKSRYAKLYLDSAISLGEADAVVNYERQSYVADDDAFLTDMETAFKILVILVLLVVAASTARRLMGTAAAILLSIHAFGAIIAHHNNMRASIRLRQLALGIGGISNFVNRVGTIPELQNIPSFEEFKASIARSVEAAEAGDDTAAAEAFLDSYGQLNTVETELLQLQAKYREENPPSGPAGVAAPPDDAPADMLSGNDPDAKPEGLEEDKDKDNKDGK
ncbi:MAG: hypothetical protein AB7K09_11315 [Planctomycetota bacterium]